MRNRRTDLVLYRAFVHSLLVRLSIKYLVDGKMKKHSFDSFFEFGHICAILNITRSTEILPA